MTVYEVAFRFQAESNQFYNVVHYDITGDEPLDLQDLTDEIVSSWATNCASVIAPAVSFEDITYRLDIDGSIGATFTPTGNAEPGTATDNQWAGQMAMLVRKKTNGLVRPNLGRAFVVGITSEGLGSDGFWTGTVKTAVEAFWDNIILVPFAGNGQAEMLLKASNPEAPNTNAYNSVAECTALRNPSALQSRKLGSGI